MSTFHRRNTPMDSTGICRSDISPRDNKTQPRGKTAIVHNPDPNCTRKKSLKVHRRPNDQKPQSPPEILTQSSDGVLVLHQPWEEKMGLLMLLLVVMADSSHLQSAHRAEATTSLFYFFLQDSRHSIFINKMLNHFFNEVLTVLKPGIPSLDI